VKLAASLLDYLDRRLGRHSGRGPEYQFPCPACIDRTGSESNKRKFSINLDRRKGQCFRCEFRFGDIAYLFRYLNNGRLTVEERILLREDPPILVGSVEDTVRSILNRAEGGTGKLKPEPLPREYVALDETTRKRPALRRAHLYLERRVPLETAKAFRVGFCPSGEYAGYLIFPVVQGGRVVYWTNRFAGKQARIKTKNPPKRPGYFSREHCLLNYDRVVGKRVVQLVEGPFDCMAPPNAIALMGRVMSPEQARLIAALTEHGLHELVLLLDPGTGRDIDSVRSQLQDAVPLVTALDLSRFRRPDGKIGDPADLRDRLPALLRKRRVPTLVDRTRLRVVSK